MNLPFQTVHITGLAPTSAPRNLFFFAPVYNEHGKLVDLQRRMAAPATPSDYLAGTCLSDWIAPSAGAVLDRLWSLLEQGTVCRLTYQPATDKVGQLLITPMDGGYLVELLADLPADAMSVGAESELVSAGQTTEQRTDYFAQAGSCSLSKQDSSLDATNQLLEAIVSNTPVGLALLRPIWQSGCLTDFSYLWTNPAHAALIGYSTIQLAGQRFKALHPSATSAGLFDRLANVAQTGQSLHYQKQVQHDGLSLWGEFAIIRVGENVLFTVMDISPLMEAKALLSKKNSQLEIGMAERTKQVRQLSTLQNAILKHAGQAIISTNSDGIVQTVNQATETLLGLSASELIGKVARLKSESTHSSLPVITFCPYDSEEVYNFFAQPTEEECGYVQQECLLATRNGRLAPVLLTVSQLKNEDGSVLGYMGIATDISALKLAEAKLRQKNQILDTFFAGALDMHCIADRKGFLLEVNRAFQDVMGYSAGELRTIPFLQLIHPTEQAKVSTEVLKKSQQQPVRNRINKWRCKDGTYRIVEWSALGVDGLVYGSARDITDRQAAEDQLYQLHERLQLATKAAGQGIWENDLINGQVIWDERLWELHGLSLPVRPLTFADFLSFVHPDDLPALMAKAQAEHVGKEDTVTNVYRIVCPNGAVRYLETNGRIVRDSSGKAIRLIGVAWDVTRRKLDEENLRASEQRYRSLVDHLDTVVFQTDAEGKWVYLNPAWEVVTGFSVEESLGGYFLDSILPEDYAETRQMYEEIKAGQRMGVRHTIRYIRKGGGYRWVDVNAQVLLNDVHMRMGISGTLTDITERKMAEEAIQESEQRFREIAENVDEVFCILDSKKPRFLYVNPAFEKFTGVSSPEIYRKSSLFLPRIVEEDRSLIQTIFQDSVSGSELTFRARHRDGSLRWLNARVFGVTNEAGVLIRRIGVATDITTAIEKEQILKTSLQNERTLNTLKSQFITTASHEFRTPLMAISSSTELVKHYMAREDIRPVLPIINKHLTAILTKVASLNELIGDTLTLSKIEQGKIDVQLASTDLAALCKFLVVSTSADSKDKRQIDFQVIGKDVALLVDKKLMNHILTNLLMNAIKFSTKSVSLTITYEQTDVKIAVSDQGIGIPKKDLPHLFDKFFRASNAANYQGSGLGLAICQEYISLMQGQIGVTSKEGAGTTFTITLPYA
ncbi:PAS domain S-box protein [Spirosoma sp.]|uniref:PAS domain S-box protein n=1 Tax=Spirosoma sp. TaxID=1899569 RepID=UPI00261048F4|nr:PAS domain S-box protein [Spirosoma sp.]MCX6218607.1 PAS domain S-box protein [Spirosoma sp.]